MTQQAVLELRRMNRVCYAGQLKPVSEADEAQAAKTWEYQFRDWPDDTVKQAYLAAQRECPFPVGISDIFRHLPTEPPSWEKTMKAAREIDRWLYYGRSGGFVGASGRFRSQECIDKAAEVWNTLPPSVRRWAGTMSLLAGFADQDPAELAQYVRPGFAKATENELLPPPELLAAAKQERQAIGYKPLRLKKKEG